MSQRAPIPVTVIGGFLGAGKTTLLNRILREADGRRIAVIVNDFGELNIDEQLIVSEDDQMVALANGCICCSIGDDFLRALAMMTQLPDPPDQLVIEASGISDPSRIAALARIDKALLLHGVYVLVDVTRIEAQLANPRLTDTVEAQLAGAHLLVLTKSDLVEDAQVERVRALLGTYAPDRPMAVATSDTLPLDLLLERPPEREVVPTETHAHGHGFWTASLAAEHVFNLSALKAGLAALPPTVLRVKGFVSLDEGQVVLVQWVGGRLDVVDVPGRSASGLVLIGVGEAPDGAEIAVQLAASASLPT